MSSGNAPKSFLETYWEKYSYDRKRFSDLLKKISIQHPALLLFIRKACWSAYQPYKWFFVVPLLAFSTVFLSTIAILTALLINARTAGNAAVIWSRLNSFFTPMTVKVKGLNNIQKKQSYIIVANHMSLYDIYVLYGWSGMDIRWVMKQELRKIPVIGFVCSLLEHIYIDRKNPERAIASINNAKSKIKNGTSIIFFPEGSRSSNGELRPFKKGAFRLASDLGLPVLPVTINGTQKVLKKGSLNLQPGMAEMIVHEPFSSEGISIGELMNAAREKIESGLNPGKIA